SGGSAARRRRSASRSPVPEFRVLNGPHLSDGRRNDPHPGAAHEPSSLIGGMLPPALWERSHEARVNLRPRSRSSSPYARDSIRPHRCRPLPTAGAIAKLLLGALPILPPTVQGMPLVPQRLLEEITDSLSDDDLGLLLMIRHFERKLLDLFGQGLVQGTTHTCLGQEYVPVALAPLLDERDYVSSNHRGHGHYPARFRDPYGLLAEILGREGAVCGGVGGSQHILSGRYLSTGIQGESLPVATGVALRLRDAEPGALALAYIGDGTWGEGAVYEALNMAALWRLPLVVVTENNGIAQTTPTSAQLAGTIGDRARAFG